MVEQPAATPLPVVAQARSTWARSVLADFAIDLGKTPAVPARPGRDLPPPITVVAPDSPDRTIAQVMAAAAYSMVAKAQNEQDNVLDLFKDS